MNEVNDIFTQNEPVWKPGPMKTIFSQGIVNAVKTIQLVNTENE